MSTALQSFEGGAVSIMNEDTLDPIKLAQLVSNPISVSKYVQDYGNEIVVIGAQQSPIQLQNADGELYDGKATTLFTKDGKAVVSQSQHIARGLERQVGPLGAPSTWKKAVVFTLGKGSKSTKFGSAEFHMITATRYDG